MLPPPSGRKPPSPSSFTGCPVLRDGWLVLTRSGRPSVAWDLKEKTDAAPRAAGQAHRTRAGAGCRRPVPRPFLGRLHGVLRRPPPAALPPLHRRRRRERPRWSVRRPAPGDGHLNERPRRNRSHPRRSRTVPRWHRTRSKRKWPPAAPASQPRHLRHPRVDQPAPLRSRTVYGPTRTNHVRVELPGFSPSAPTPRVTHTHRPRPCPAGRGRCTRRSLRTRVQPHAHVSQLLRFCLQWVGAEASSRGTGRHTSPSHNAPQSNRCMTVSDSPRRRPGRATPAPEPALAPHPAELLASPRTMRPAPHPATASSIRRSRCETSRPRPMNGGGIGERSVVMTAWSAAARPEQSVIRLHSAGASGP
ncbi:hypothetical protein SHL15_9253 [Streptomyces hygroscopicus subsp. limoneus]|nr:hypothetical protein SHL15_9253 [Streptomyces hygroscopicus subsp. limoneus]